MYIEASVKYKFVIDRDKQGALQPYLLGQGKFAKVFAAFQVRPDRDDRRVAIKILHDYADYAQERMFDQEVKLMKEIGVGSGDGVVSALDILHLEPMVMCGCGRIYHPLCPKGHDHALVRKQFQGRDVFPALRCPVQGCDYELSAQFIVSRYKELCSPPAKRCCERGSTAEVGTILNFINRRAIVMEFIDSPLDRFIADRRQEHHHLFDDPASARRLEKIHWTFNDPVRTWLLRLSREASMVLLRKTMLLEKVRLMVELTSAVERLHVRDIVHKDLAPDNIMIKRVADSAKDEAPVFRSSHRISSDVPEMIFYPKFQVRIIDFGLSDKGGSTRSWYEEERGAVPLAKRAFWSPEALQFRTPIGSRLEIEQFGTENEVNEENGRFKVPSTLALLASDTIADRRSQLRDNDLTITRIVEEQGHRYAYFKGTPPPDLANQQFDHVPQLGEPHDIFALGALYYFILTESAIEVEHLTGYVQNLQRMPNALKRRVLLYDKYYLQRREAIVYKFWPDDLMSLILRAMVRGHRESFVQRRTEKGPRPVQRLLQEIKAIYFEIHRDIIKNT
jgi:serine/threonine protein kinase